MLCVYGGGFGSYDATGLEDSFAYARLLRVTFDDCHATNGGGMYTLGAWVEMTSVVFRGCQSDQKGGALLVDGTGPRAKQKMFLSNVTFTRCYAGAPAPLGAAGLFLQGNVVVVIEDSTFIECRVAGNGVELLTGSCATAGSCVQSGIVPPA